MRRIKIGGMKFDVLSLAEEAKHTKDCDHEWKPHNKEVIINPAMEYVIGYGCEIVSVLVAEGERCTKCGRFVARSNTLETHQGDLRNTLARKSHRQTICQLLRELRDEADSTAKVDQCILMAKRMNDKLVEYCGRGHSENWFDEDGEYIA